MLIYYSCVETKKQINRIMSGGYCKRNKISQGKLLGEVIFEASFE